MFRRIDTNDSDVITISFEGEPVSARPGESVAAALLAANKLTFRETPVSGSNRGPFCMMGVCFDCLMIVDGQPNIQACQVVVRDGIKVARQKGAALISPGTPDAGENL